MADSLLVAVVGVLGTLAGGGLTATITFRSERRKDAALAKQQELQLRASEQQQRQQLQAEERRQIRELQIDHRRQVYQQFLTDVHEAHQGMKALGDLVLQGDRTDNDINVLLREANTALRAARGSLHKVQLEGPESVSSRAYHVVWGLSDLPRELGALRRWQSEDSNIPERGRTPLDSWHESHSEYESDLSNFVEAARQALADLLT